MSTSNFWLTLILLYVIMIQTSLFQLVKHSKLWLVCQRLGDLSFIDLTFICELKQTANISCFSNIGHETSFVHRFIPSFRTQPNHSKFLLICYDPPRIIFSRCPVRVYICYTRQFIEHADAMLPNLEFRVYLTTFSLVIFRLIMFYKNNQN